MSSAYLWGKCPSFSYGTRPSFPLLLSLPEDSTHPCLEDPKALRSEAKVPQVLAVVVFVAWGVGSSLWLTEWGRIL